MGMKVPTSSLSLGLKHVTEKQKVDADPQVPQKSERAT
jgi:hypothetical protein